MAKVKYVVIGFGGIAENRVAKEGYACDRNRFKPLKTAQLVGAMDMNAARKPAAEALGLKWYGSLDEVLADKSVDGVYIASNNASHAELACAALNAGKHVIVEKPIATSIADAKKMEALAKKKGLSLSVDHVMVNNAWNIAAAKATQGGKLGKVNDSCFHMEFAYGYDPAEAATWRCSNVAEMGGPIGDVASHCFYVAEFIFGKKIKKVAAVYYPKVMKIKAEDGAYIKFFFEDGTQGSVNAAFSEMRGGLAGTLTNLGYEIYGDKAALEWQEQDPENLIIRSNDAPIQVLRRGWPGTGEAAAQNSRLPAGHPEGFIEAFANIYKMFAEAIRTGKAGDYPSVTEGVAEMRFLEAIVANSNGTEKWTTL